MTKKEQKSTSNPNEGRPREGFSYEPQMMGAEDYVPQSMKELARKHSGEQFESVTLDRKRTRVKELQETIAYAKREIEKIRNTSGTLSPDERLRLNTIEDTIKAHSFELLGLNKEIKEAENPSEDEALFD